jgi:hypothetical protein
MLHPVTKNYYTVVIINHQLSLDKHYMLQITLLPSQNHSQAIADKIRVEFVMKPSTTPGRSFNDLIPFSRDVLTVRVIPDHFRSGWRTNGCGYVVDIYDIVSLRKRVSILYDYVRKICLDTTYLVISIQERSPLHVLLVSRRRLSISRKIRTTHWSEFTPPKKSVVI